MKNVHCADKVIFLLCSQKRSLHRCVFLLDISTWILDQISSERGYSSLWRCGDNCCRRNLMVEVLQRRSHRGSSAARASGRSAGGCWRPARCQLAREACTNTNIRDGTSYSAGGRWLLVSPEVEFDPTATILWNWGWYWLGNKLVKSSQ